METWCLTPNGHEFEETGFFFIHHRDKVKFTVGALPHDSRNGAAIVLSPQARASWEFGNRNFDHSDDGRVLAVELPLSGGLKHKAITAKPPAATGLSGA